MNFSDSTKMIDFWNDEPEIKSKLDEFLFALIYLADKRSKKEPNAEVIHS